LKEGATEDDEEPAPVEAKDEFTKELLNMEREFQERVAEGSAPTASD